MIIREDSKAGTDLAGKSFVLRLFVAGSSAVSLRAINNLQLICAEFLKDSYTLEIIDAHQQPQLVKDENITALPMLVKKAPLPKRRLIGDFSDREKVLKGLGIKGK